MATGPGGKGLVALMEAVSRQLTCEDVWWCYKFSVCTCQVWRLSNAVLIPSVGHPPLGAIPPAASIAGLKLPTFSEPSGATGGPSPGDGKDSTEVRASSSSEVPAPFTLGEGLPPVPGKLVQKIQRGEFVDMAELLRDNMELERRRTAREMPAAGLGLGVQPSRREVPDLISWVQCFGVYAAVVSVKHPDRLLQLLAYQTTIVREARRCGGRGWLSYDAMFRQQAAISPSVDWSKLNNSLYSTTFLQQQNGRGRTCVHCMETDHSSQDCALAPLRTVRHSNNPRGEPSSDASMDEVRSNRNRGTKVCYSWNDGKCAVPYCRYRHVCAKCSSPSHKALHCNAYQGMRPAQKGEKAKE